MAMTIITLQDDAEGNTIINVQSDPPVNLHEQPADDAPGSVKTAWIALNAVAMAHAPTEFEPVDTAELQLEKPKLVLVE